MKILDNINLVIKMDTSELKKMYEYERHNLNSLCEKWQKIVDNGTRRTQSEDTKGAILAVLGQSRLLLNKKLKQFEQILIDPEGKLGDMPPITLSDLEGFWEVVMIQVNDVYSKFSDLEKSNVSQNESSTTRKNTKDKVQRSANIYAKHRGQ